MTRQWIKGLSFLVLLLSMLALTLTGALAEERYVLDATLDLPAMAQGEKADGDSETFKDYFTVMYSAKNKIDGSNKAFDDGYTATQRLNFGGKTQPDKGMINTVRFETQGAASIRFWWVSGGDGRQFALYSDTGEVLVKTEVESVKNSLYISDFSVDAAGVYYLGVPDGSNYLFKLEVTEAAAPAPATESTAHVLDATLDLPAMAQGEKADGDSETFKDYFTVMYSAKNKIDGSNKAFDDGYTATQRLNFGGKTQPDKGMINTVRFETQGAASIRFWWVSGGDGRQFALYSDTGEVLVKTEVESVKNSLYISDFSVDAAGVYYLGVPDGSNYLFKLEVTEAAAPAVQERILDATADLTAMAQGEKMDGDTDLVNDFFTIHYSAKTKIDGSSKEFDDGYTAAQRLNFGGKTQPGKDMINSVRFTAEGAGDLKLWWVSGGDGRQFALYDAQGVILCKTEVESVKNALYISTLPIDAAGTYYLGVPDGSNYLFRMQLTTGQAGAAQPVRRAWADVPAPTVTAALDKGDGTLEVTVAAPVGFDGGDEVIVSALDSEGNVIATRRSIAEKDEHVLSLELSASGSYSLTAVLNREGEESKSAPALSADFTLPLGKPAISSATSAGGGSVALVWAEVQEATGYEVLVNGASAGSCESTEYTVSGLTIGEAAAFTVRALRGEEAGPLSAEVTAIPTEEAQRAWSFVVYGPSTNEADNGYIGSVNETGSVTVYSENGKGKIQPNADDGVAFYYTAVPADKNFTLRAKVHVDNWDYSNGQEGFGLMAADSVPAMGTGSYLTNQYMALATKLEFYWYNGKLSDSGTKYTMRLGLGVLAKLGRTPDTKDAILGVTYPLDTTAPRKPIEEVSNYNVIGNNTNRDILDKTAATIAELTDFDLEIQRNNTGYFITYYDENGEIINQYRDYDPNALTLMDSENVYVGFFAARRARATFSDVQLTVIDPADDAAVQERPVEKVLPSLSIVSGASSNSEMYPLSWVSNVAGTVDVYVGEPEGDQELVASGLSSAAEIRNDYSIRLPYTGEMAVEVVMTPDPAQDLGDYRELASTRAVSATANVVYINVYAKLDEICVTPYGTPSGLGTPESPLNLVTAVKYARPGQTILLAEGTYSMLEPLRIPHGIDGTADQPIRLIAAPDAASRPVLDFQNLSAGIIHGGDYWYFEGFDVTRAANGQKGFQVSGHYNTLENLHTYHNGNSGIQISRYAGSDPVSEWPSYNLILNCTSWGNADAGYEDADGFAAKLTCGPGNVLDGCVAYNNADDGYDLYAKIETGPIGAVTIRNSVAYANGILEDGTIGGNGNGFKLGGSNIPGGHRLENSYAFFNRSKGIDSNSCPDVIVENCVSYNNLRYNVALYTNIEQDTAYQAKNVISFKDATISSGDPSEGDEFKPKGNQDPAAYQNDTCYYWNGAVSANTAGDVITAEDFVSLEFKGVNRLEDGSIDLQGFLQRK